MLTCLARVWVLLQTIHHCTTCAFDLCVNCLPPTEAWRLQNSVRIDAVIEWCFSKVRPSEKVHALSLLVMIVNVL